MRLKRMVAYAMLALTMLAAAAAEGRSSTSGRFMVEVGGSGVAN